MVPAKPKDMGPRVRVHLLITREMITVPCKVYRSSSFYISQVEHRTCAEHLPQESLGKPAIIDVDMII